MTRPILSPKPAAGAAPCRPLAGLLPSLTAGAARASRLGFDARLAPWLRQTLQRPEVDIVAHAQAIAGHDLAFECRHGRFTLCVDTGAATALSMALALPNRPSACAVAALLLQPLTDAMAPWLPGLRLACVTPATAPAQQAIATVSTPAGLAALVDCDDGLLAHLAARMPPALTGVLPEFETLRLSGRIRLMTRRWAASVLASLNVGDVALLQAGEDAAEPCPFPVSFGIGTAWRATVSLDMQEQTVHIADIPELSDDDFEDDTGDHAALPDAPAPRALDDLQLPVSFELDTARISLAELGAMQPGHALALNAPLSQAVVRLVCQGQTVGTGQLVAIGDQLGVRITAMGLVS